MKNISQTGSIGVIVLSLIAIIFLAVIVTIVLGISPLPMGNSMYIDGIVVDTQTNDPLPDIEVRVSNRGWGFDDGHLVWDHDYVYPGMTDQNGRFHITYQVGQSAHVIITKEGYYQFEDYFDNNSNITIKLTKFYKND